MAQLTQTAQKAGAAGLSTKRSVAPRVAFNRAQMKRGAVTVQAVAQRSSRASVKSKASASECWSAQLRAHIGIAGALNCLVCTLPMLHSTLSGARGVATSQSEQKQRSLLAQAGPMLARTAAITAGNPLSQQYDAISAPALHLHALPLPRRTPQAAAVQAAAPAASTAPKKRSEFDLYTFNTWLFGEERRGTVDTELATVLSSISVACKQIAAAVGRAGITNLVGVAGTGENIQGEEQKKLDVISNDIFSMCLRNCGRTGVIASEEEDLPIAVEETTSGNYIVVFDPLDGSSNIDAGISVGSIFGARVWLGCVGVIVLG